MGMFETKDNKMTSVRICGSVVRFRLTCCHVLVIFGLCLVISSLYILQGEAPDESDQHQAQIIDLPTGRRQKAIKLDEDAPQRVRDADVVMAMDRAQGNYADILDLQKQLIKSHVRPPDSTYNLNVTHSDGISLDRPIDDTRPDICREFGYDYSLLGSATVIIPFYNEPLTMLLRTVHSVLNRSPDQLLDEVILVDDMSTMSYLKGSLEEYLKLLPKVTLLRNTAREGLVVSRMNGARRARSPVLIFLDAHTEANVGWLEALLDELHRNPRSVIQPFVDGIDAQNLLYSGPPNLYKGAFSWDLRYVWLRVPDHIAEQVTEYGIPYFSPTLVGCAMAVRKRYFNEIGAFDEDMKVWGGENIELAWRTWMCGGRVVTVPCSRVGHVFKDFAYKFDGDKDTIIQKNAIRVADTWMDSMKKYFYASTRIYPFKRVKMTEDESRSLSKRIEIRHQLNCKTFEWYLEFITPELEPPPMDAVYYGEVMSVKSKACFQVFDDFYIGTTYYCYEHKIIPWNYFRITRDGLFMHKEKCVNYRRPKPILMLEECPRTPEARQAYPVWQMVNKGPTWGFLQVKMPNPTTGAWEKYCVMQVTNALPEHLEEQMPQLSACDADSEFQLWAFTYRFDHESEHE